MGEECDLFHSRDIPILTIFDGEVRRGPECEDPGMGERCAFSHPRDIPILTVPYPGGGRVAKRSFVGKGGWQFTNEPFKRQQAVKKTACQIESGRLDSPFER